MSSQVGQKLAKRMWDSFDKYLNSNGKDIHYKKYNTRCFR